MPQTCNDSKWEGRNRNSLLVCGFLCVCVFFKPRHPRFPGNILNNHKSRLLFSAVILYRHTTAHAKEQFPKVKHWINMQRFSMLFKIVTIDYCKGGRGRGGKGSRLPPNSHPPTLLARVTEVPAARDSSGLADLLRFRRGAPPPPQSVLLYSTVTFFTVTSCLHFHSSLTLPEKRKSGGGGEERGEEQK